MITEIRSTRMLKNETRAILSEYAVEEAIEMLQPIPPRKLINPLLPLLLSHDDQLKWKAVVVLGAVVANLADQDIEAARIIIRRLMWSLNDESGGIGWGAPEALGEILAQHLLFSFFLIYCLGKE